MAALCRILQLGAPGAACRFAAALPCPFVICSWLRQDPFKINICRLRLCWDMGCRQEPGQKAAIWRAWLPRWPVAGGYRKPQASLGVRHKNNAKTFFFFTPGSSNCTVSPDGRVGNGVRFITVFTLVSFAKFSLIASSQKASSKKNPDALSPRPQAASSHFSCSYLLVRPGSQAGISAMEETLFKQEALLTWQC